MSPKRTRSIDVRTLISLSLDPFPSSPLFNSGRQLDYARSGIEVLEEVTTALKQRNLFPNPMFQIFVDGGVRRASDVLKAVAMGATAVGIGRPFLYACEFRSSCSST